MSRIAASGRVPRTSSLGVNWAKPSSATRAWIASAMLLDFDRPLPSDECVILDVKTAAERKQQRDDLVQPDALAVVRQARSGDFRGGSRDMDCAIRSWLKQASTVARPTPEP